MPMIEGFRIQNYRALKNITIGKLWKEQQAEPLTPLTVVIGKNGVGKSSIFDAFGFLADCLKNGVEEACDMRGRGGFQRLRSKGVDGSIEFELYFKEDGNARPITYELAIDIDKTGRPFVARERLRQRRKGQKHGWPLSFVILDNGKGVAWKGESDGIQIEDESTLPMRLQELINSEDKEESRDMENVELEDNRKLGISTIGSLKQHPRISAFRKFIEDWYLSYFRPDSARSLPLAGPQKHLNSSGDNLGNFVQYMEREYKDDRLQKVLNKIASKIPGIDKIYTKETPDNRLLLCFNDQGFKDPFYSQQMSDGTLKIFAYLLLLEDPNPSPFLCIEEPENGLYHKLLEILAAEFRVHATGRKDASQIFVTTHQPHFVNALEPDEVWILEKGQDGFSTIRRASDDLLIGNMVAEGLPLGNLWYSDYLDAR